MTSSDLRNTYAYILDGYACITTSCLLHFVLLRDSADATTTQS